MSDHVAGARRRSTVADLRADKRRRRPAALRVVMLADLRAALSEAANGRA